jgi:hypothetical protein
MGFSGIWLNHRNVMKLQLPDQQQINAQLVLPDPRPETIDALAAWLQQALKVDQPANNMRVERSRPVAWAERGAERSGEGRPLMQPERWTLNFGGPNRIIQVEYWVGNKSVGVRTTENGFVATLTNLHKGVGMPMPWILLIDTLAGSLIFLSLSGVILWWETNSQSQQLLVSGAATMGMINNGRVYDSVQKGASLALSWDLALQSADYLVIPRGSKNIEAATALTVAYLAVEILLLPKAGSRWAIAGILGVFHGLYFSLFIETTQYSAPLVLSGAALAESAALSLFALVFSRLRRWTRVFAVALLVFGVLWFLVAQAFLPAMPRFFGAFFVLRFLARSVLPPADATMEM